MHNVVSIVETMMAEFLYVMYLGAYQVLHTSIGIASIIVMKTLITLCDQISSFPTLLLLQ